MSGQSVRELERNNLLLSPSQRIGGGKTYQLIYRIGGRRERTIRAVNEAIDESPNWILVGPPTSTGNSVGFVVKASSLNRNSWTVDGMLGDLRSVDPFGPGLATLVYFVPVNLGTQAEKAPQDNTATAAKTKPMTTTFLGQAASKFGAIPRKLLGGARGLFGFIFSRGIFVVVLLVVGLFFLLPRISPALIKAIKP